MAKRRPRSPGYSNNYDRDYDRNFDDYGPAEEKSGPQLSVPQPRKSFLASLFNATTIFVLAGVFILGIGVGMAFASMGSLGANTGGTKIVTQYELDNKAPNSDLCVQFGASAIVTDMRVFVTLNPLNFFVSQPVAQPGCVLRNNNWSILEQRGLVNQEQVRSCKQRMNTFGFTRSLEDNPQIDCIYQNDVAKNLFLDKGPTGRAGESENNRF
ncbi:DUF3172 domain-containing protein [Leptodesmis sp.]|uniref:DUF3172 domain-containing protein n=1 Tax=Leptodesmis sp. TaxID=3100501 RepID=UPI0040534EAF